MSNWVQHTGDSAMRITLAETPDSVVFLPVGSERGTKEPNPWNTNIRLEAGIPDWDGDVLTDYADRRFWLDYDPVVFLPRDINYTAIVTGAFEHWQYQYIRKGMGFGIAVKPGTTSGNLGYTLLFRTVEYTALPATNPDRYNHAVLELYKGSIFDYTATLLGSWTGTGLSLQARRSLDNNESIPYILSLTVTEEMTGYRFRAGFGFLHPPSENGTLIMPDDKWEAMLQKDVIDVTDTGAGIGVPSTVCVGGIIREWIDLADFKLIELGT